MSVASSKMDLKVMASQPLYALVKPNPMSMSTAAMLGFLVRHLLLLARTGSCITRLDEWSKVEPCQLSVFGIALRRIS
jgi:hypothetical protein